MSNQLPRIAGLTQTTGSVSWQIVFLVASCFFLLTCSGKMGSSDAYTQLQAAVLFVQTGSVSTNDPTLFDHCSVPSPNGRYYQAHDPGNIILFLPATVIAVVSGGGHLDRNVLTYPHF